MQVMSLTCFRSYTGFGWLSKPTFTKIFTSHIFTVTSKWVNLSRDNYRQTDGFLPVVLSLVRGYYKEFVLLSFDPFPHQTKKRWYYKSLPCAQCLFKKWFERVEGIINFFRWHKIGRHSHRNENSRWLASLENRAEPIKMKWRQMQNSTLTEMHAHNSQVQEEECWHDSSTSEKGLGIAVNHT